MAKIVSAIIPAYNEAERIGRAIAILRQVHMIGEIIVVDDGSQDDTAKEARPLAHLVLMLQRNRGKSYAMHVGVAHAQHDIILFCDADMYGFTPKDIEELLAPVVNSSSDMSVGLRSKPHYFRRFLPITAQFSGLRALLRTRWNSMPFLPVSGFQIELALYIIAKREQWKTSYLHLPDLRHSIKEDKYGLWKGLRARIGMIREIIGLLIAVYLPGRQPVQHGRRLARFRKANRLLWE